jgi:serine/threonine protein kinase
MSHGDQVIDDEEHHELFLVMEYIDGHNLQEPINQKRVVPDSELRIWIRDMVCEAPLRTRALQRCQAVFVVVNTQPYPRAGLLCAPLCPPAVDGP